MRRQLSALDGANGPVKRGTDRGTRCGLATSIRHVQRRQAARLLSQEPMLIILPLLPFAFLGSSRLDIMRRALLVAEGFNRVEAGGAEGGVAAEEDADEGGEEERPEHRPEREVDRDAG